MTAMCEQKVVPESNFFLLSFRSTGEKQTGNMTLFIPFVCFWSKKKKPQTKRRVVQPSTEALAEHWKSEHPLDSARLNCLKYLVHSRPFLKNEEPVPL